MPANSRGTIAALIALIVLGAIAAYGTLTSGTSLLVPLLLVALALGCALLLIARWRPERVTLLLAVVVVVFGAGAAGVRVADGISDTRVNYHGKLDSENILRQFHPRRDPVAGMERRGVSHIESAEGEMTVPQPSSGVLVLWSVQQLAPWLLAAIVLLLVVPILRAADRGDPFWEGATRRLTGIGTLLLLGIPAIAILRYVVAESANVEGALPIVEPGLTLSISQILPGVLVLALAGIFRRGVELRELERHTV